MSSEKKITSIEIAGLQEMFDYKIDFAGDGTTAILIAPNGFGKTAFLAVLNACLQFRLAEAASYKFDALDVTFDDKTRWLFKKTEYSDEKSKSEISERNFRAHRVHRRRLSHYIKFICYDSRGKIKKDHPFEGIEGIPSDVLTRVLDRNLPVTRVGASLWRDMRQGDTLRTSEVIERYSDTLLNDIGFRDQLGEFAPNFVDNVDMRLND